MAYPSQIYNQDHGSAPTPYPMLSTYSSTMPNHSDRATYKDLASHTIAEFSSTIDPEMLLAYDVNCPSWNGRDLSYEGEILAETTIDPITTNGLQEQFITDITDSLIAENAQVSDSDNWPDPRPWLARDVFDPPASAAGEHEEDGEEPHGVEGSKKPKKPSLRTLRREQYNEADYYRIRPCPFQPWSRPGRGNKHLFQYDAEGSLMGHHKLGTLSNQDLYDFITHHPVHNKRPPNCSINDAGKMILWIQKCPADSSSRYSNKFTSLCRFESCPTGSKKIKQGHLRIALDEKFNVYKQPGSPFKVAGYVHLFCAERYMHFNRVCVSPNVLVRSDNRVQLSEPNNENRAAIDTQASHMVREFVAAAQKSSQMNDNWSHFRSKYSKYPTEQDDAWDYKASLCYRITRHLWSQKGNKRAKENFEQHMGDLEVAADLETQNRNDGVEKKKENTKQKKEHARAERQDRSVDPQLSSVTSASTSALVDQSARTTRQAVNTTKRIASTTRAAANMLTRTTCTPEAPGNSTRRMADTTGRATRSGKTVTQSPRSASRRAVISPGIAQVRRIIERMVSSAAQVLSLEENMNLIDKDLLRSLICEHLAVGSGTDDEEPEALSVKYILACIGSKLREKDRIAKEKNSRSRHRRRQEASEDSSSTEKTRRSSRLRDLALGQAQDTQQDSAAGGAAEALRADKYHCRKRTRECLNRNQPRQRSRSRSSKRHRSRATADGSNPVRDQSASRVGRLGKRRSSLDENHETGTSEDRRNGKRRRSRVLPLEPRDRGRRRLS